MKKYTIDESILMLENKKGAGKCKKVNIKIDMDLSFEAGPWGASSMLTIIKTLREVLVHEREYPQQMNGMITKNRKLVDHSSVSTELENNPEWKF